MKAAQISNYGGQEAVEIVSNAPRTALKEGQVLVEVYAASANPFDWKVREGAMGDSLKLPAILGGDVAGKVAEIGPGAEGYNLGEEVYGMANAAGGQGSFAEFTPVAASQLVPKPKSTDFKTAAALPLTSLSAYQALIEHMNLQPNQKILIHGGAGGIGSMAIQLAKYLGAYVATTASASEMEYVKSLGADIAIDYKSQDFSQLIKGYDAVFDTVGGETNSKSYDVLKPRGILVSMVQPPDEERAKALEINYVIQGTKATKEKLNKIAELVDESKLKVKIDKVFPLDQTAEALEYLKNGHPKGKVVIQVKV